MTSSVLPRQGKAQILRFPRMTILPFATQLAERAAGPQIHRIPSVARAPFRKNLRSDPRATREKIPNHVLAAVGQKIGQLRVNRLRIWI